MSKIPLLIVVVGIMLGVSVVASGIISGLSHTRQSSSSYFWSIDLDADTTVKQFMPTGACFSTFNGGRSWENAPTDMCSWLRVRQQQ